MTETTSSPNRDLLKRLIHGNTGCVLILFGFACFLYLALRPFDWDPPSNLRNGAKRLPNGHLEFREPGKYFQKHPPSWIKEAMEFGSFTLNLSVRPFTVRSGGPDRIITLSKDQYASNFTIGQHQDILVVRIYDPKNPNHKTRFVETGVPGVFEVGVWRQLQIQVATGRLTIQVDGEKKLEQALPEENMFVYWNPTFQLALGNEHNGRRPWLGEIEEARIRVGEQDYDILNSEDMMLPETFWSARFSPRFDSITKTDLDRMLAVDYAANLLCFIPLGFLIAARKKTGSAVTFAIALCGLASLGVEISQIFFDQSFPSIYDWLFNTAGGAVGAIAATWFRQRGLV